MWQEIIYPDGVSLWVDEIAKILYQDSFISFSRPLILITFYRNHRITQIHNIVIQRIAQSSSFLALEFSGPEFSSTRR